MKPAFLLSKGLLCLCDKQNNTWLLVDMEFLFSFSTRHLTRSLRSLVSYQVKHSKRNSISTRAHVLFSIYLTNSGYHNGICLSLRTRWFPKNFFSCERLGFRVILRGMFCKEIKRVVPVHSDKWNCETIFPQYVQSDPVDEFGSSWRCRLRRNA